MAIGISPDGAAQPLRQGAEADPARRARLAPCYRMSALVCLLLAVAAGVGLSVPGIYRGNTAFAAAAFRGTDLVSLVVALPTLAASMLLARSGSQRAPLVWLGVLAYVAYTYLYVFAIAWNRLFLVYVALLSLSVFTIVRALTAIEPRKFADRFSGDAPVAAGPAGGHSQAPADSKAGRWTR